jgi:hypothetical protein
MELRRGGGVGERATECARGCMLCVVARLFVDLLDSISVGSFTTEGGFKKCVKLSIVVSMHELSC